MGYTILLVALADLAVIGVCVFYLTRASGALDAQWQKQRVALDGAQVALERLIAHADERARELEDALGKREQQLRDLLYRLAEQEDRVRAPAQAAPTVTVSKPAESAPPSLALQAHRLAASGLDPVEVSRELRVDPAQVRVMLDLYESASGGAGQPATGERS